MAAKRSSSFRDERHALDEPPMSRLFVVCGKDHTEEEFTKLFQPYGNVEEVWMVKDRNTGESKGVVYVKFSKTSEAALALEALNGKVLVNGERPIKVLVASNRSQGTRKAADENEKCVRLFVLIPRTMNEDELQEEFSQFGEVDYVTIIRDKASRETKGFAYVKFRKFSGAANAFENCDRKYKAMFAEPKPQKNDMISSHDSLMNCPNVNRRMSGSGLIPPLFSEPPSGLNRPISTQESTLNVICSSLINQDQLWRLFDIIPGLDYCHITGEFNRNSNCAIVAYSNSNSASYAREKLHGFEYPMGERLIVKGGADAAPIPPLVPQSESQGDIQCSVQLPPVQPLAGSSATVAQRCFIVCVSQAIPVQILRNVFCRFGDLIEVYLLPNKNCGYAKFAREESCRKAIEKLNGAEVYGVRLKVMEAEELSDRKRQRRDD
ncbi:RNA-binding protein 45 [Lutzomyia longipalpis]|uniref:Putative rna-binding protein 45 n=1 Tax=Lutzomyia longipalpis TaxID=7200 RepID=A0A7G3AXN8_LUTLO|nr:RNA-binding protein 45 [Lutzomyia longipalpis]